MTTYRGEWFMRVLFVCLSLALTPVWAMTDAEIEAQFTAALEESDTGNLAEAIAIFESILSERPTMNRVRMELALANFRALNYAVASSLAERVLKDPSTPEPVRVTIRAFLSEIEGESRRHQFTPYFSVGWFEDDNIT